MDKVLAELPAITAEYKSIIGGKPHDIQLLCANCHQVKTAEDRATGWLGAISIQTAQNIEE